MHFINQRELAKVEKPTGEVKGPYKAKFTGSTIFIDDGMADVEEGDFILRKLPNGKDERSLVAEANFYHQGIAGFGPHYQIKFTKGAVRKEEKSVQNININNAQGIQIGDYNKQDVMNTFESLIKQIEASGASPEQKIEVKSLLKQFLEHPLTAAIVGSGVGLL